MQINAFVPAESAIMAGSAVNATQIPFTSFRFPPLRGEEHAHQLTLPVVLCVSALNGEDYDPHFYIQARDPDGQARGNAEVVWYWEDVPGMPCKWRVWDLQMPFLIFGEGVYTVGIYENPDDPNEKALSGFPMPIFFDESLPPLRTGAKLPPGAEFK